MATTPEATTPHVVSTVAEMRAACDRVRAGGGTLGLVPTMGFLHEGHRTLMRAAAAECDAVAVTIFVNPLQFGPGEDLDRYPRDLEGDLAACAAEGVTLVFAPTVAEIYPEYPARTTVHVSGLTEGLCGAERPGHFDGVTTVVAKLFSIAGPCRAYFGRKDAQQLAVIARMSADLNLPVEVIGCPLVREPDGLARSSRNAYLTAEERAAAPGVFAALRSGAAAIRAGARDSGEVVAAVRAALAAGPFVVQYVEVRDARTIAPVERIDGDVLVAVAVLLGTTRLIDNIGVRVAGDDVSVDLGAGWQPDGLGPGTGP